MERLYWKDGWYVKFRGYDCWFKVSAMPKLSNYEMLRREVGPIYGSLGPQFPDHHKDVVVEVVIPHHQVPPLKRGEDGLWH